MDITAVLAAAGGSDKALRDQAEAALKNMEQTRPDLYFVSLAQALADAGKEAGMRQLAGIMIKNALDAQDDSMHEEKVARWRSLDPALRGQVKSTLLSSLAAEEVLARSAAAQAIAKIAGIEIPNKEWADIIPMLLGHAANPALPVGPMQAILMTISYLLEEIEASEISPEQIDQVLGCFVLGLAAEKPVEIQQVSASGMLNVLPFASANFEDAKADQRNLIMTAICNATQCADLKTRLSAFECISLVASLYYTKLQPYMDVLFRITVASVSKEEPIAIRAIEFWNTVCEVEIVLAEGSADGESKKYAAAAVGVLVPLMTSCMIKQPEEYDEQMTLSMAAGMCLALIAQATGDVCLAPVAEFLKTSFDSPDWHFREAAAMALGSVMEGPSEAALLPFVKHFAPLMIAKLAPQPSPPNEYKCSEPNVSVRDTCAWALGKVVLNAAAEIDDAAVLRLVEVMCACLKDEPRVVVNACYCLNVLSSELASAERHSLLSPSLPLVIRCLGDAQSREDWDENNLRDTCWAAIGELLKNTEDSDLPFVQAMLQHCLTMLSESLSKPLLSADDRTEQFSIQSSICGTIQTITNRLEDGIVPFADAIMTVLHRIFGVEGSTAIEDALMAVSALANHAPAKFPSYLDALHPMLMTTLQEHANLSICVAASIALGDISRAVGPAILKYSDAYVGTVLQNLGNAELGQTVKSPLLSLFGDLALATGSEFKRYLPHALKLLAEASTVDADPEDEDEVEFQTEIRTAVLEAYTGIAQGYAAGNKDISRELVPHLPAIIGFCQRISDGILAAGDDAYGDDHNPDLIEKAVGLLGDLQRSFERSVWVPMFSSSVPWVARLLTWQQYNEGAKGTPKEQSLYHWAVGELRA